MLAVLSRTKYGWLLTLDNAMSWRWALMMPWFVYITVSLLLYIVGDGAGGGLLALCAAVTFVTIVVTSGHRISDNNRSVSCPVHNNYILTSVIFQTLDRVTVK